MPVADQVISQMHASLNLRRSIYSVEEPEVSQLDPPSDPFSLSVFSINAKNNGIVPVKLNEIHLLMELDTGAGFAIITKDTYNRHFKETPLQTCDTRLHTYTGNPVQVSGQFNSSTKIRMSLCHSS